MLKELLFFNINNLFNPLFYIIQAGLDLVCIFVAY